MLWLLFAVGSSSEAAEQHEANLHRWTGLYSCSAGPFTRYKTRGTERHVEPPKRRNRHHYHGTITRWSSVRRQESAGTRRSNQSSKTGLFERWYKIPADFRLSLELIHALSPFNSRNAFDHVRSFTALGWLNVGILVILFYWKYVGLFKSSSPDSFFTFVPPPKKKIKINNDNNK